MKFFQFLQLQIFLMKILVKLNNKTKTINKNHKEFYVFFYKIKIYSAAV